MKRKHKKVTKYRRILSYNPSFKQFDWEKYLDKVEEQYQKELKVRETCMKNLKN